MNVYDTHTHILSLFTPNAFCRWRLLAGRRLAKLAWLPPPSTTANIHKIRYRFIRSPPKSRCDKKKHSYWRWFFCCCIFACRFCDRVRLCVCCTQMCPSSHSRRRSAVCVCVLVLAVGQSQLSSPHSTRHWLLPHASAHVLSSSYNNKNTHRSRTHRHMGSCSHESI